LRGQSAEGLHGLKDLIVSRRGCWCGRPGGDCGTLGGGTQAGQAQGGVAFDFLGRSRIGEDALEDFETTLTFVAVEASPPDGIARRSLFGWVGDSPAFILRSGEWCPVDPSGSEDAATGIVSSRTNGFFTSKRLDRSMSVVLAPDEVVLISSDGIGSVVSDGSRTLRIGTLFADLLAHPTEVMRVLNLLSFDMRSADDDRTAIIVWQLANGAATPPVERLDREPAGNDHEGATAGEGRE
jgi:serine/threonine protein phosphatase PrpC